MQNTIWDRLAAWGKEKLEEGFEEGASIQIKLSTGETIPAEVRVFKSSTRTMPIRTRRRPACVRSSTASLTPSATPSFSRQGGRLEHIAGSMLVTLDCTDLGQTSRNAIFMSNRETFRDDPLLQEIFKKLQKELRDHEGLHALNMKRYEEKIANATSDELGISALEELLATDPALADLFGSMMPGKIAAEDDAAEPRRRRSRESRSRSSAPSSRPTSSVRTA